MESPRYHVVASCITERKMLEERLSALNIYGRSLNKAESMEEIYALTLDAMEKTLGFEYASFFMVEGKMLRLKAHHKYPKQLKVNLPLEGEKGVTVKAATTGKSVLVPDIRKEKTYVDGGVEGMLSELAVPIKIEEKVLGVLNVESDKLAAFDEKDKELLEILASHAAIAASNLERREELRKISEKIAKLMESSTEIMHTRDMHKRLDAIATAIQDFGWRRVVISLRDENLESIDMVTAGLTKEEIKLLMKRKAPGHIWRERLGPKFKRFKIGEFYYLPWNNPWVRENVHGVPADAPLEETTTYAGVPSRIPPEEMVDWHPQDMLYAPIHTPKGKTVGILSMDDPADGRKPTRESLIPLELFLHQAAVAIENAQLIQQLNNAKNQIEEYADQLELKVKQRTQELIDAQNRLLKAERMATIGEVAAMVGHDLRNPLTGIAGATYYLRMKLSSETNKKTKEMLELIEKDIEYMNQIINDLLEYSKEMQLELTETTPKSIMKETLSLIEVPKNIQVSDLTQSEPRIRVDAEKLKRVFVNIIKNAVDAMPNGGKLTITSEESDGTVKINFTDTGTGIPKDILEKIWTPLFTTKAKGMGLGLPICKRILETHEGDISVESTLGKGATFTVTIPIKPKSEGGEKA